MRPPSRSAPREFSSFWGACFDTEAFARAKLRTLLAACSYGPAVCLPIQLLLGNTKGSQTLEGSGVRVHEGRGKGTILKPSQTPDP